MRLILVCLTVALCGATVIAQNPAEDTGMVPERVVVVSGDPSRIHRNVVAVLYDSNEFRFHDPSAPRFLFLDRQGKIALGIGGYVYATAAYNWAGSEDSGSDFIPSMLPTPADPAQRAALQFTAQHSTVFLQLAGHSDRFGTYSAYVQTDFTGGSNVLKLKQAYFRVGYVTLGLKESTFVDAGAGIATVDTQGPNGALDVKDVMFQYAPQLSDSWKVAVAVEAPEVSVTNGVGTKKIAQRVPDIPVYVQYQWGSGSHLRASAMLRNTVYRDELTARNRYSTGYGVQLSGVAALGRTGLTLSGCFVYGRGIASYVADLKGSGLDLLPSATPGRLEAPKTFSYGLGLRYDFSKKGFATLAAGQAKVLDRYAASESTYKMGYYLSANVFYTLFPDFLLGLEYARGERRNWSGDRGTGNRLMLAARYSF